MTEGTVEFLTPSDVAFDAATSGGNCSPAVLDSIWSSPPGLGALIPVVASHSFGVTYLFYCGGATIRILLDVWTDARRRVGHLLYPRYIWIRSTVLFRRAGDSEEFQAGASEVTVDTEQWDTNRVELGPRNDELNNFPGMTIANIRGLWLEWNTPWQ